VSPQHFHQGSLMLKSPQLLHNTRSIFCHQVQFFYYFLLPEVSDNKLGVDGGTRLPTFSPRGHLCFCFPQLLPDAKSIFCHQVQFFCFFYHLKSVITNLRWMGRINTQIIWWQLVNAFVPPNFCMTQSQVPFFYYSTMHLKSMIAKPREEGVPQHFHQVRALMLLSPNFFMTQNQYTVVKFSSFYFFYHLKSVIANLGWIGRITSK